MKILAIDIGEHTGFAWCEDTTAKPIRIGSSNRRFPLVKGDHAKRLKTFQDEMMKFESVNMMVFEDVMRHSSAYAARAYSYYRAVIYLCSIDLNVNLIKPLPVKSVKKLFTGNGNASKDEVLKVAREYTGKYIMSYDEADAVSMLHYALNAKDLCKFNITEGLQSS